MANAESAGVSAGINLSLAGKAALVTGGSRGIGAATVRMFTRAGARVAFNFRESQPEADALAAQCRAQLASPEADICVGLRHALNSAADGRALVEETVRRLGRIDVLIANHGVWPPTDAPVASMTDAQWRSTMEINLDAVFGLTQAAVRAFQQQGRGADGVAGHIVLISSTAGQRGEAFHCDYAASKGALISLTKSLSSELAPQGIRVNCVAPGWVHTDMAAPALNHAATREKIFGTIPMGRVATPEEIAGPVLFLCTPLAGFMSGEIVNVNGGAVLVG
jgi:3-oxoacyl-[acyl-carrier protein] reductase